MTVGQADPRIKAVIIDDEPLARDGVRMLLARDAEVDVIGEAGSGQRAVELIRAEQPDLVFLDVEMPELNGFEVLGRLDREQLPVVVFISAYDAYAMRAFEVHALDYLQKPYDDARFFDALARAKEHLRLSRLSNLSSRLIGLLETYEERGATSAAPAGKGTLKRIAIRSAGRVIYVDVESIDWIEAADYYVQLHLGEVSHLHRQSMSSLEEQLAGSSFCRIHRSAIVNLTRVREVCHGGRRDLFVVLENGVELRVARRHREKLQRKLDAHTRA